MKVFVYDPTANDPLSRVRGVGRYLQILRENFEKDFAFVNDPSLVAFDSVFINPFVNFTQSPVVKKKIAHKQIAVIHDLTVLKYPVHFPLGIRGKLKSLVNKASLKNYDFIVTDSQASKKDIVEMLRIDKQKVKVIYPVLPKIFAEYEKKSKGSYAIYVGDATWNKNLVNMARAIKEANVTCVFIGKIFSEVPQDNPWQKELHQFLELTHNDRRFIFPGFINDKQLLEYYRQARVNLLLSRAEGFGFSYFEAGSQGTGSILSDIPVFKETAKSNALFVNPEDVNEIANAIIEVYLDPKKQRDLGSKARKRSTEFNREQFRQGFLLFI